jgi:hypothetical protein
MIDPQDCHGGCLIVDLVNNPVRSATSRPQSGELALERVPNSARRVDQRADHEFNDRGGGALGQASK